MQNTVLCRRFVHALWSLNGACELGFFHPQAAIVETTFVVSLFSDIRKERTSFLVVPKKPNQEQRSFSVGSDNYTTRNDQERPGMTRNEPINGGKLG